MQINEGKFLQNGKCGYILKPSYMLRDNYNPFDTQPPSEEKPQLFVIKVD